MISLMINAPASRLYPVLSPSYLPENVLQYGMKEAEAVCVISKHMSACSS